MIFQRGIFSLIVFASLAGCVSVSLDQGKVQRSSAYRLSEPGSPFVSFSSDQVDRAWKNNSGGTIISVVSECSPSSDPTLTMLRNEVVGTLVDLKIETEKEVTFQGRAALRSFVTGKVDGVDSSVDILVLKKNGCSYILGLIGTPRGVRGDQAKFDKFLTGFEVP